MLSEEEKEKAIILSQTMQKSFSRWKSKIARL